MWEGDKIAHFEVGEDCPFYKEGHEIAKIQYKRNRPSEIKGVYGPWAEFYTAHQEFEIEFGYANNTC